MPVRSDRQTSFVQQVFGDEHGRVVLAQPPNAAIGVWTVVTGVRLVADLDDDTGVVLRGVAAGALVVWALDEVLRGATSFRRLLGAGVLAYQVVAIVG